MNINKDIVRAAAAQRGRTTNVYVPHGTTLAAQARKEITVNDITQILRRRKATFIVCLGLTTLTALAFSLILPKRYEGVARLKVDRESPDSFGLESLSGAGDPEIKMQTEVNVLWTDSLAWDVIKRLRLDQRTESAHRGYLIGPTVCVTPRGLPIESVTPECRRVLLDEFHQQLHVQSVPKTEVIEIRYRSKSRELAAKVVNTMADIYIDRNFQSNYQTVMRASDWLSGQLQDVKRTAEMAEQKYIEYQKRTGIIGIDATHNVLLERLNALNQQLMVAQAQRIMVEARYRVAMDGDPEALAVITPGSTLQVLHSQEVALRNQYAQLETKFGDAYPRVIAVKAQLDNAVDATHQEIDRTRDKIKAEYDAALNSETMLRGAFEVQKQLALNTNDEAIQVGLLKRDVDAGGDLYEQLVKKVKEAGIVAGLKATNVSVIDPAGIPISPSEPRPVYNMALGMFVGLLGGAVLCFLQETVDTRITTLDDVTDICAVPALGMVPNFNTTTGRTRMVPDRKDGNRVIISLEQPESEMADAYRSVRTALLLSTAGTPPQVLLVTSPLPRDGKTTTSVNTAVVFAQKKRSVLLVDGDLRRADVHKCLNLPANGGLSAALVGEDVRRFYVPHPSLANLTILPAGARPPKPPDLLDSDRMRELIAQWRQEFSHVIIDAPPVLGLSDSVILSTMADTVILVVRANQSRRQDLTHAKDILANVDANVVGAVINDFDVNRIGYYGTPTAMDVYFTGGNGNGHSNGNGNGNGNGKRNGHF